MTDIDDGSKPAYDLPSPSKAGAIEVPKDSQGKPDVPGADADQFGEKTGWTPRFGWPTEPIQEGASLLDHSTWLEGQIPDKFYGGKSQVVYHLW